LRMHLHPHIQIPNAFPEGSKNQFAIIKNFGLF